MTSELLAGALVVAAVTSALAWRHRREAGRLRNRLEHATLQLQSLQMAFGRFAPGDVIERIITDGVGHTGERKEVTVLFADLVGSTELAEAIPPPVLVRILNGYFERMSRAISTHGGYVSTFIGDGLLALFGAIKPNPWQGNDAVHAALAMRRALAEYNVELAAEGLPGLRVGIGLEQGDGVVGLVGSRHLKEFTFVSPSVHLAARLEGLTRVHPADVIVTRTLGAALDPRFRLRELPDTPVKGIEAPVAIYAVDGFDGSVEGTPGSEPGSVEEALPAGAPALAFVEGAASARDLECGCEDGGPCSSARAATAR